jgi:hypothetical protein
MAPNRIQPGGWLIYKKYGGGDNQTRGEIQAAAHSPGILTDGEVGAVFEGKLVQQFVGALPGLLLGKMVELSEQDQILASRENLIDSGILADEPDLLPNLLGLSAYIKPGDTGLPIVEIEQGRQNFYRGGFSGSIGAE